MNSINLNSITGIPYSTNSYGSVNNLAANPTIIIVVVVIIICYYALFASLGNGTTTTAASTSNSETMFVEILLWAVFVVLIIMNGMAYLFNFDVTASIKKIFSSEPEIDIIIDQEDNTQITPSDSVPEITTQKQVFHIPGNKYDYENSKAICNAYGGHLATYKELEDSYAQGSDWCSYGWSDGQMALFPTQYEKWEKLSKIKGHEHDCGRAGINGGYIANPNVRFGINCYGYKPEINNEEINMMNNATMYPLTAKEIAFDRKVDYWKNKLSEIIVSPFNHDTWSSV
jgi:hypothetical protein